MTPQQRWEKRNPEKRRAIGKRARVKQMARLREPGNEIAFEAYHAAERERGKRQYQKRKTWVQNYQYQKKYGITLEQRNAIFDMQGCKCKACHTADSVHWAVDHDHETKEVRSILCLRCNTVLGFLENTELMRLLYGYLHKPRWDDAPVYAALSFGA